MSNILFDKHTLTSIRGLYIPESIPDFEVDEICVRLDRFVDLVPVYTDYFYKNFLPDDGLIWDNYEGFLSHMEKFKDICRGIHADSLVYECGKLMEYINLGKEGFSEIMLQHLVTNMATLSIAIQIAQLNSGGEESEEESALLLLERQLYKLRHSLQNFDAGTSLEIYNLINRNAIPLEIAVDLTELGGLIKNYNFDSGAELCKKIISNVLTDYISLSDAKEEKYAVLAVDDKAEILNSLREIIPKKEYKFYAVTSGGDALKFIKKRKPDLCFLDIEMPEMDGYTLAEIMRTELELDIPLLFLTGHAGREEMLRAFKAGASDFLVKPIDAEHLIYKLSTHIKKR